MGLGEYAGRVADAMKECKKARITGLISHDATRLEEWRRKYKVPASGCYGLDNYKNIGSNSEVDAVYVLTPHDDHVEPVINIAEAGKHVICEKPMAATAADCRKMIDACKANGVKLLVGYRMHFEPHTRHIVQMRRDGKFGKIMFFQGLAGFCMDDEGKAPLNNEDAKGGALLNIGIYAVNGARYMVGEDPVWVTAQETPVRSGKFEKDVDETIQFQLGFPSGALASCLATHSMDNLDRFFLNGSKGYALLHPATGYEGIGGETHEGELKLPQVSHQAEQLDEMAGIILENKEPLIPVDGEEGYKDLRIIEAIREAVKSGNKVQL